MATSAPRHFACEKGHPVREGSTVCVECGAQVTARAVSGPRSPTGSPADAVEERGIDPNTVARRRALIASIVGGVIALAGAALAFGLAGSTDNGRPSDPGGSGLRAACGGVANAEVEIGAVLSRAPALVCFVVTEEITLTVGATSLVGGDLTLKIETAEGLFWAEADDTLGLDPQVSVAFIPGTYVVAVTEYGDSPPGDFDLGVGVGDGLATDPSLPLEHRCGDPGVPLLFVNGPETVDGVSGPYACLEVADPAFVKVGLIGEGDGNPDLNLAIHSFEGGRPVFLRSVDDTVGVDPEVNLLLDPGVYLLEVWTVDGSPPGEYSVYADDTRTYFRTGQVSAPFANLTASDCTGATYPKVAVDGEVTLPDGVTVACVTIPDVRRVALGAHSGSSQDLTLEVVGFAGDGTPVQYGTVDDDLWAVDLDDYDPRLDIVLPAGTYALGVSEFWGAMPSKVVVSVEDLDR